MDGFKPQIVVYLPVLQGEFCLPVPGSLKRGKSRGPRLGGKRISWGNGAASPAEEPTQLY